MISIPRGWTASHPEAVSNPWRWFRKRHPSLARLLRERAGSGAGPGRDGNLWWESSCEDEAVQEKTPRVLFREWFDAPVFAYDNGRAVAGRYAVAIPASGPYLAGVLNSRLIAFIFAKTADVSGIQRTGHSWNDLRDLPVYTPDFDNPVDAGRHDRVVSLVTRLLDLRKQLPREGTGRERESLQKKIDATDRKIDCMVYELYGLKSEEIVLIEETVER